MFCPNCGKELGKDAKFCNNCGQTVQSPEQGIIIDYPPDEKMNTAKVAELIPAANYYSFRKSVKSKGTANIIFGIISIILGAIYAVALSPINVLLVLIGIFLLAVGIWAKVNQSLSSLLLSGIALLVLGAWNIVVFFLNVVIMFSAAAQGDTSYIGPIGIIWGGVQIVFAVDAFNRYRRYSANPVVKPTDEALRNVDAAIKPVISANFKNEAAVKKEPTTAAR